MSDRVLLWATSTVEVESCFDNTVRSVPFLPWRLFVFVIILCDDDGDDCDECVKID